MLRVELRHARPGMVLALPLLHPQHPRQTLLKVGCTLDQQLIDRLYELRFRSLWVQYPGLDFLADYVSPQIMAAQGEVFTHITETFEKLQTQSTARLSYKTYCHSIGTLVRQLVENPKAAVFLSDLADTGDDEGCCGKDLFRHSSAVTYLSLLMGLKLEGYVVRERRHIKPERAKEVTNLGVGAMLHDLGISGLDRAVKHHYARTGDESDPAWREHPSLGYGMVRGQIEPSAATVVLNHHQRWDGSGYAGSAVPVLDGHRIHIFARIVGLAEQFDRLRNPSDGQPRPTVGVLGALLQKALFRRFDPQVMYALLSVVPPYPPGTVLRLSDGRWAVGIDHHPDDPCRPTVQIITDPREGVPAGGKEQETMKSGNQEIRKAGEQESRGAGERDSAKAGEQEMKKGVAGGKSSGPRKNEHRVAGAKSARHNMDAHGVAGAKSSGPGTKEEGAGDNEPRGSGGGTTINLAEVDRRLFVAECEGQDVSALNFPRPRFMHNAITLPVHL